MFRYTEDSFTSNEKLYMVNLKLCISDDLLFAICRWIWTLGIKTIKEWAQQVKVQTGCVSLQNISLEIN